MQNRNGKSGGFFLIKLAITVTTVVALLTAFSKDIEYWLDKLISNTSTEICNDYAFTGQEIEDNSLFIKKNELIYYFEKAYREPGSDVDNLRHGFHRLADYFSYSSTLSEFLKYLNKCDINNNDDINSYIEQLDNIQNINEKYNSIAIFSCLYWRLAKELILRKNCYEPYNSELFSISISLDNIKDHIYDNLKSQYLKVKSISGIVDYSELMNEYDPVPWGPSNVFSTYVKDNLENVLKKYVAPDNSKSENTYLMKNFYIADRMSNANNNSTSIYRIVPKLNTVNSRFTISLEGSDFNPILCEFWLSIPVTKLKETQAPYYIQNVSYAFIGNLIINVCS